LFGASGFTSSFINQISGSIGFNQCQAESFLDAIERARQIVVSQEQRRQFLDRYDAQAIYAAYARHILGLKDASSLSSPKVSGQPVRICGQFSRIVQ
jgi:hypothetical protein